MEQSMTQMNIRLGAELKASGDEALKAAHISPSRAIRALWTFLQRHANETEVIIEQINELESDATETDRQSKERVLQHSQSLISEISALTRASTVDTPSVTPSDPTPDDSQLMEDALAMRYAERGLL